MTTRIQLRRDDSSNWDILDPALAEGEIGFETDTGKFKIGNGSDLWSELDYFLDSSDLSAYAPIVDPVFTDDIQVDGQINLAMSGSVATSYISSFNDLFAGGPSTKLLGRYVQVETDVVEDQFSRLSLQPEIAALTSTGNLLVSGDTGTYINSVDPDNQIATFGDLSSYQTKNIDIVAAKTGAYTIASGDQGELIELGGSASYTISIPTDATFNFAIGTQITLLNITSSTKTIAAATPATTTVNATPGLKLRTQWSSATLIKRAANLWVVVGDLSA